MRVLACRKLPGCLRSFPSRLKAPHSMPTETFTPYMFNYSSPSVKNSALLPLASIHTPPRPPPPLQQLADRSIFGIWCRAALLFLLSSLGLLAVPRSLDNARRLAGSQKKNQNRRAVANTRTAPVMQHICQWWIFESLLTPHHTRRLCQAFILFATDFKFFSTGFRVRCSSRRRRRRRRIT